MVAAASQRPPIFCIFSNETTRVDLSDFRMVFNYFGPGSAQWSGAAHRHAHGRRKIKSHSVHNDWILPWCHVLWHSKTGCCLTSHSAAKSGASTYRLSLDADSCHHGKPLCQHRNPLRPVYPITGTVGLFHHGKDVLEPMGASPCGHVCRE